jgi:excisionase family DNA binding protein
VAVPARQLVGEVLAAALEEMVEARVAPLRLELEKMRAAAAPGPVTTDEAARRLGVTVREVQRRLKDGRLTPAFAGGNRMVAWPPPPFAG